MTASLLWYRTPASVWTEALPVGNGRLGAMIFGGVGREELQLNEDTLWSGGPYQPINPEALPHLDELRSLIFAGRYAEAERLADRHSMARPLLEMSFQPAGNLWVDQPMAGPVETYRRELDLDRAVATTTFSTGGVLFRREVFVSPVDQVLVLRIAADRPGAIAFELGLTSEQTGETRTIGNETISFSGRSRAEQGVETALRFAIRARVQAVGGAVIAAADSIAISGADEAIILLDIATSFRRFDDTSGDPDAIVARRLDRLATTPFATLLTAHETAHRRLYRRLSIELGNTPAAQLPTDERIIANQKTPDPALAALYVQYSRYLMISASRPGTQPATLQGIWNKETAPPWGSKYTANINLQMNYWLPGPANLAECFEPLIALAEDVAVTGAEMARAHYGARGWVLHHNTDLWRATGPVDGAKWGLWPTGGAWLAVQLWDHLSFDGSDDLVRRLYPILKGAVEFFVDTLVPLPGTELLVTNPSLSPENMHPHGAALCAGPSMDRQILRDLFNAFTDAATCLGVDAELTSAVLDKRARLPPDRIGAAGQLQEWLEDWDLEVPEIQHRHVSHLYAVYPSRQIDLDRTPQLAVAARKSLELRGDDATGWGIGWRINLWARLRQAERAYQVVQRLLGPERTYPNMFDAHPPFQIDGNFGGAAGILEMLVQSEPGQLRLLPALPAAWPDGQVGGVKARGNLEVDLWWKAGDLTKAELTCSSARRLTISYREQSIVADTRPGTKLKVTVTAVGLLSILEQ